METITVNVIIALFVGLNKFIMKIKVRGVKMDGGMEEDYILRNGKNKNKNNNE